MVPPPSERRSAPKVLSHLGVMALVAALMGLVAAGLAIPLAGALGVGAQQVAKSVDNLPAELQASALPQKTFIYDSHDNVIATLYDENRINVSLDQVSRTMVKAIVAIEDYRFYQHGALDLKGTLRAMITNQANNGVVQGGSSITQQMVKMTLVNQAKTKKERAAATDDTYARKIRELRYAIAVEQQHSKDWILERYLNIAYFGDGAYGVQAAAQHYFNVNAKDLDLRQSALLAGLVKNPTGYDPTDYPERARERRDVVLDRMAQLNVISPQRAAKVEKQGLGLDVQRSDNGCIDSTAPWFCEYVVRWLEQDKSLGKTAKDRRQLLLSGGLKIHTTIDLRYQKAADNSVAAHVHPGDQAIGGLAMVEPGTGQVRALAQSRPMGREKARHETFLNYTVPYRYGDARGFQPGSTFKAFVLASALEQGIPLSYALKSPNQVDINQNEWQTCKGPYDNPAPWQIHNSTGEGTFDLTTGTRESVNTFYAQLELATGLCEPYRLARQMGIHLDSPKSEMTPSFTLGAADVSPLEMAGAYATFAARGMHCETYPVTVIDDADGNQVKKYSPKCKQLISESTADAINGVLRGVQEPGGFGYSYGLNLDKPSAGKTGTTTGNMAVWFVGYTPELVTASGIAGVNPAGQPRTLNGQYVGGTYIDEAFGSKTAGPMWKGAMGVIQQWLAAKNFTPPNFSGRKLHPMTTVPSVTGMSLASATAVLHSAGLKVAVVNNSTIPISTSETVVSSFPTAGSSVLAGGSVLLTPSSQAPKAPPKHGGGGNGGGHGGGHGGGRH
ncbi:MAG: transglycosylase domain-containing protein [Nocardioides sp.]|uniref:transglycosylase domain-containing protein n=1 Tax=Nocardioides sp. TaxID=35761 RepID=UPI0039E426F5